MRKIMIIGLGYVGTSLSLLLSQKNQVYAFDKNKQKVSELNRGYSSIKDKEINDFLKNKNLFLKAYEDSYIEKFLDDMDFVVLSVPTDYKEEKEFFDTEILDNVIVKVREKNKNVPIIIKSTIPIGYVKKVEILYGYKNIIFIPEFLRETKALYDNLYPSRIIAGYENKLVDKSKVDEFIDLLKECAWKTDIAVLEMDSTEAEAVKLFSNTYLAMRVAYFNEVDTFAEHHQLDSESLIKGIALDPRIGEGYNNPSFGYGGYCLPKDTKQLLANYKNIPQNMMSAIIESNNTRKKFIAKNIIEQVKNKNEKVGIYHLVMKKNSDNFRESAIIDILKLLKENNVDLVIYEPTITHDSIFGVEIEKNLETFKESAGIIIANRFSDELNDVKNKVYTRDIFQEN